MIPYQYIEDFIGENGLYKYTEGGYGRNTDRDNPSPSYITIAPHPPFIPADIWLACNLKADGNVQIKNSGKGSHTWLSGLMKCGYCGLANVVANRQDGNHKLICGGKKRHSCEGVSTDITVRMVEDYVEPLLLDHLRNELAKSLSADSEVETPNTRQLNDLSIELVKVNREIDNLVEVVATAGTKVAKIYNDKISKLDVVRERITNDILALKFNEGVILSPEKIQECIEQWGNYPFEKKILGNCLSKLSRLPMTKSS